MLSIWALALWERNPNKGEWLKGLILLIPMLLLNNILGEDIEYMFCHPSPSDDDDMIPTKLDSSEEDSETESDCSYTTARTYLDPKFYFWPSGPRRLEILQGLGSDNWHYTTGVNRFPDYPVMHRSSLMPIPYGTLEFWKPIDRLLDAIEPERTIIRPRVSIYHQILSNIPEAEVIQKKRLPIPRTAIDLMKMYDSAFWNFHDIVKDTAHLHLHMAYNREFISRTNNIIKMIESVHSIPEKGLYIITEPMEDKPLFDKNTRWINHELLQVGNWLTNAIKVNTRTGYSSDLTRLFLAKF